MRRVGARTSPYASVKGEELLKGGGRSGEHHVRRGNVFQLACVVVRHWACARVTICFSSPVWSVNKRGSSMFLFSHMRLHVRLIAQVVLFLKRRDLLCCISVAPPYPTPFFLNFFLCKVTVSPLGNEARTCNFACCNQQLLSRPTCRRTALSPPHCNANQLSSSWMIDPSWQVQHVTVIDWYPDALGEYIYLQKRSVFECILQIFSENMRKSEGSCVDGQQVIGFSLSEQTSRGRD